MMGVDMRSRVLAVLLVTILLPAIFLANRVQAASLVEVTNFGTNPTGLRMYLYVPNSVAAQPAILLALHYCTGTGPAFYSGTEFASLADRYGFIVIYPSATRSGSCWDVSSPQALQHNGGSDPVGLISMVTYVEQHNNGDPNRVYVTGASSGGMMTNVLLGDYPDVFKAGAAFMGVPFGCFTTTDGSSWNSQCANGQITKTPQQWGDLVRAAYPGYTGARPRMQVWHGTADGTLNYNNFGEEIKQWTNVLGVSQTPAFTDQPQSGWTRTRYGATGIGAPVEAISVQGVGHSLPLSGQAAMAIQFFGLDNTGPTPTVIPPTSIPSTGTISINPGGSATGSFTADQYYSGGTTYTNSATIDLSQITTNPPPTAIFNSERYGAMTYTIPNRSGTQTVTLYFAETYLSSSGQRLFNVTINGTTALSNFDIYASAGAANRAIARTFTTTANSSGQVVIQFISGTQNPKINGITVTEGGTQPTSIPPTSIPPTGVPPTSVPPTSVPPTGGPGACSPVTSTIAAPFTFDGAGTFCWQASSLGSTINSWNLASLTVNGVDFTNRWAASGSYPPAINGYWYVSYTGSYPWSHFEAR
jgi:acetylxylan esterase